MKSHEIAGPDYSGHRWYSSSLRPFPSSKTNSISDWGSSCLEYLYTAPGTSLVKKYPCCYIPGSDPPAAADPTWRISSAVITTIICFDHYSRWEACQLTRIFYLSTVLTLCDFIYRMRRRTPYIEKRRQRETKMVSNPKLELWPDEKRSRLI